MEGGFLILRTKMLMKLSAKVSFCRNGEIFEIFIHATAVLWYATWFLQDGTSDHNTSETDFQHSINFPKFIFQSNSTLTQF